MRCSLQCRLLAKRALGFNASSLISEKNCTGSALWIGVVFAAVLDKIRIKLFLSKLLLL